MFNRLVCIVLIAGLMGFGLNNRVWAKDSNASIFDDDYIEINLTSVDKIQPVNIYISKELSQRFQFLPGKKLTLQVYVQSLDGERHFIKDSQGREKWEIILDDQGRGSLTFLPAKANFTGRLAVLANQKVICDPGLLNFDCAPTLEYVREYRFKDNAGLKVHFTSQILEEAGAGRDFPQMVLEAAARAYQKIVNELGFNRKGYSFALADETYAYDEDKTIDIYIGSCSALDKFYFHSLDQQDFRKAPFYEVRYQGRYRYSAIIAVPADYRAYLKGASRQFGYGEDIDLVSHLNGAMMHEMLHIITFYYNKNLVSSCRLNLSNNSHQGTDWYVEGLARYSEIIAGFKDNFYSASKDFYQKADIFMSQPEERFSELGYDFAIFWKYFHSRFGIDAIEELSYRLRSVQDNKQAAEIIGQVTGVSFSEILKDFAESVGDVRKEYSRTNI